VAGAANPMQVGRASTDADTAVQGRCHTALHSAAQHSTAHLGCGWGEGERRDWPVPLCMVQGSGWFRVRVRLRVRVQRWQRVQDHAVPHMPAPAAASHPSWARMP
jgi:hypothetical protein